MKSIAIALAASATVGASTIFDDDHEFMKGFETGVMMRSKNTSIDEFGCKVPDEMRSRFGSLLGNMAIAMDAIKMILPNDLDIENGFDMVHTYVEGLSGLALVVDPKSNDYLDDYCRGIIFGQEGSQLLFKIASQLRNQDKS